MKDEARVVPIRRVDEGNAPWNVKLFMRVPLALMVLGVSSNSFHVYAALCYRWFKTTGTRYEGITVASLRDLSKSSGLSTKQIRNALDELAATGWIYRHNDATRSTIFVARDIPQQAINEAERVSMEMFEEAARLSNETLTEIRMNCAQLEWRKDLKK